uniref:Centromere protein P n=1 Tax=Magallana gigas TaxID=29159 RepID=K1Q1J7_MAGGI
MAGIQVGNDIRQTINLFGEEDKALGQTLSVLSRPVQRKTLPQGLDQDLTQLEKEIDRLTEHVRQKTETVSRKSQELYSGKPKVERTKEITGVSIQKYSKETDETGKNSHLEVEGGVLGNQFSVQFDVEIPEEENSVAIRNLNLLVEDGILKKLHDPLLQLSDNNALGSFFSLMEQFSRWNIYRQETFHHFTEKYPDIVSTDTDEETVLLLQNPQISDSLTLCVMWSFTIDPLCRFHPDLRLKVIVHKQLLEADQENVIKEAPQMFQKMVDLYGIERGIDAMVQLMSGG